MRPLLLVAAEAVGHAKLAARCPFCTLVHVWDTEGRKPKGGILHVSSLCNVNIRKAFEHDGMRRRLALLIVDEPK